MDQLSLKMSTRLFLVLLTVVLYSCLVSSVVSKIDDPIRVRKDAEKRQVYMGLNLCQLNRRNCPGGFRKRFSPMEENGSSSTSDVDSKALVDLLLSGQPWEERDTQERQRFRQRIDMLEALQDIVLPPDSFDSRQ
ncbi:uncharacterized protein LOC112560159 isoform X2 [Pomacea canaliculata]|uniref:uncharacterized protein LOC112560159 isoform X2 n=1 Tax=Pomacea canaliculata TaxID=400727 RepID=UPI000D73C433|nr:uncharacterized protein LOC112560159 isoform X2 [Pomacea canaliculata]